MYIIDYSLGCKPASQPIQSICQLGFRVIYNVHKELIAYAAYSSRNYFTKLKILQNLKNA